MRLERFARRFIYLRLLRGSLALGAVFDLVAAAVLLVAPRVLGRALDVPLPDERFYLWFVASLLVTVALVHLLAAFDLRRYAGALGAAIAGRILSGSSLAVAAQGREDLAGLWWPAAALLVLGVGHALFWWPVRS